MGSLNCQTLCLFFNFFADISKKIKTVIAILVSASESSPFNLLENGYEYYALSFDVSIWSW